MSDKLRFGTRFALFAVLVAFAPAAMALGLGNVSVQSYLNEPLRARIDLIVRENDDIDSLSAGLASADDFALIGADRAAISVPLRFAIEEDERGRFVLVTSALPVADPVVRIIVEVNWSSGRMLREYTLFLDPPSFSAAAPAPVVDQRQKAPAAAPVTQQEPEIADSGYPPAEAVGETPERESQAVETGGAEYGPVRAGQTLWSIAADWSQGTGLDMNTAMIAIQRSNPQAFINNNINLLKSGLVLRMPQADEVAQISAVEARAEVALQNQASNRAPVVPAVETPLVDERSEPDTVPSAVQDESMDSKLELVPPSENSDAESTYGLEETSGGADASTEVESLREELARKEEELIVEQQQSQYLQDRISELESQVATDTPGNMADEGLSAMENRLREERLLPDASEAIEPAEPAVPQVVRPQPTDQKSWLSGKLAWLIGLLLVGVALTGWLLSRRSSRNVLVSELGARDQGTVRDMQDEAEKILKVLKPADVKSEVGEVQEMPARQPAKLDAANRARPTYPGHIDNAEVLDEDSADPEVRLDLARAYIAMGDKEAARVVLAEVIEHGNDDQHKEAKAMLGEI